MTIVAGSRPHPSVCIPLFFLIATPLKKKNISAKRLLTKGSFRVIFLSTFLVGIDNLTLRSVYTIGSVEVQNKYFLVYIVCNFRTNSPENNNKCKFCKKKMNGLVETNEIKSIN